MVNRIFVSAVLLTASFQAVSADYTSGFSPLSTGQNEPTSERAGPNEVSKPVHTLPAMPETYSDTKDLPPVTVASKKVRKKIPDPPQPIKPNPYDIPTSAIELIPGLKERIDLPMLGKSGGAPRLMNQNVVRMGEGRNEVVYVSFRQPNRISTPFSKPRVVDMSGTNIQVIGKDVYLAPSKDDPVGLFISDDSGESAQVAALTLVPANIPGQNISLVFEAPKDMPENLLKEGSGGSQFDLVRSVIATAINGEIPEGYDVARANVGVARIGNVLVTPRRFYSSYDTNLFVYDLKNIGVKDVELSEQSFYEDGVMGVSFWPRVNLKAGEDSSVYIMSLKREE